MKIISNLHLLLYYSVSWGNRTHNYSLGARDTTVNTYND